MHTSNPYAQGWLYNGNSNSPVSIFGALPAPFPSVSSFIAFQFTSFNPTILNCAILGPNSHPYFRVSTDASAPGFTFLKNNQGRNLAVIEWQTHPFVEIQGLPSKRAVNQWLRLSPDKRSRLMEVRGARCTWTPCTDSICLYTSGPAAPELIARITKGKNCITLEVAAQVIQLGVLEACLTATVLLQCGSNID